MKQRRFMQVTGWVILIALFIPLTQQTFGYMYVPGLRGVMLPDTVRREYSWWDKSLQSGLDEYFSDSLSIHPACVRLRNQFEYTLFNKLNSQQMYAFDGIYFRYSYDTYNEAMAFNGEEKINQQVQLLAQFQEAIGPDSIPIYVIITPSKLHYYREHLPSVNRAATHRTNYHFYLRKLEQAGIQVLDADGWFLCNKGKHLAPILSIGGVHWTLYGGALAMDSLVKRISWDKKTPFQQVRMEVSRDYKLYSEDMDGSGLCNLMFPPIDHRLRNVNFPQYPVNGKRIRPVVISDSYFHVIAWTPMHDQIFEPDTPFYYYFNTRSTHNCKTTTPVEGRYDLVTQDIQRADCIVIITDIQNLERFGFGFIERYIPFYLKEVHKKTPAHR